MANGVAVSGGSRYYGPVSGSGNKGALVGPNSPFFGAMGSKNPLFLPNAMNSPKNPLKGYTATKKAAGSASSAASKPKMSASQAAAYNKKVSSNWMATDRKLPTTPEEEAALTAFELWQMMGGGSGGGSGGPSRAQIQAQAEPSRARIEAMYKQYADMIASREADIKNNYATAGQNLQGIYGGATENVNNAYNAARAAQTAQLQALGLTEMAPPTNTQQQAYSTSILGRLGAAGMSENEAARVAAINNNLALRNAASAEGTRTLSSFDANLANALASAGSGGGGGGGGGGSFRDMLAAMTFDATRQENAAEQAWRESQAKPRADVNSLYNYAIDTLKLTPDQALKYAGMF